MNFAATCGVRKEQPDVVAGVKASTQQPTCNCVSCRQGVLDGASHRELGVQHNPARCAGPNQAVLCLAAKPKAATSPLHTALIKLLAAWGHVYGWQHTFYMLSPFDHISRHEVTTYSTLTLLKCAGQCRAGCGPAGCATVVAIMFEMADDNDKQDDKTAEFLDAVWNVMPSNEGVSSGLADPRNRRASLC